MEGSYKREGIGEFVKGDDSLWFGRKSDKPISVKKGECGYHSARKGDQLSNRC